MRIYLTGYMGSGKTSIGKRVAKLLSYKFIDIDELIENIAGKTIPQIFDQYGEEKFREYEKIALHKTFDLKNAVIATGGGTPCFFDNMEQIQKNGISFYLRSNTEFFVKKLSKSKIIRPLVANKTEEELRNFISENLLRRELFYLRATHIISRNILKKRQVAYIISQYINI